MESVAKPHSSSEKLRLRGGPVGQAEPFWTQNRSVGLPGAHQIVAGNIISAISPSTLLSYVATPLLGRFLCLCDAKTMESLVFL